MVKTNIQLTSIGDVKQFVSIANQYNFKINLVVDKYKIDGKSIMGVFSLDLSKPLTLEAETEDPDSLLEDLRPFRI